VCCEHRTECVDTLRGKVQNVVEKKQVEHLSVYNYWYAMKNYYKYKQDMMDRVAQSE